MLAVITKKPKKETTLLEPQGKKNSMMPRESGIGQSGMNSGMNTGMGYAN